MHPHAEEHFSKMSKKKNLYHLHLIHLHKWDIYLELKSFPSSLALKYQCIVGAGIPLAVQLMVTVWPKSLGIFSLKSLLNEGPTKNIKRN